MSSEHTNLIRDALVDALGFVVATKIAGASGKVFPGSAFPAPHAVETKLREASAFSIVRSPTPSRGLWNE